MRHLIKIALAFAGTLVSLSTVFASIPNNDHPTTFLGPTIRGTYTDSYNSFTAYSLGGEVGIKNFRVGGTLGWRLAENQRLKISAEYLWQKITYPFFSGNVDEWVQQGAVGALYQYHFCFDCWDPTIDVRAYYSYAPSKNIGRVTGFFTNVNGLLTAFTNTRRIAGSNAAGIAPGVTFHPWPSTLIGADLNYDNVRYDKNHSPNEDAVGLGGTARLGQVIVENIILNVTAGIRQPFNNYTVELDWVNIPYFGIWTLSLDGAYTAGKNTLPSTWNVGINANYFIDSPCNSVYENQMAAARFTNVSGGPLPTSDNFLPWVADPAVYMPQVLAIPDEGIGIGCSAPAPIVVAPLAALAGVTGTATTNASVAFSPSTGLTFSIVAITPTPTPGNTVTINPTTGIVTATNGSGTTQTVIVTIAATNVCGATATTTLEVDFED